MRPTIKFLSALILSSFVLFTGCTKDTSSLSSISIGMKKSQVFERLGEPTVLRGSLQNRYGQIVEVAEYRLTLPSNDGAGTIVGKSALTVLTFGMGAASFKGEQRDYWLYFYDGKLVQWGQAGDWRREADRIYEFRFQ